MANAMLTNGISGRKPFSNPKADVCYHLFINKDIQRGNPQRKQSLVTQQKEMLMNERKVNKMMKKLFFLVMVLVLLAAVPVYGDSYFPTIPSKTKAQMEYAPSYGAYMGVNPDQEFIEHGYRIYENVTEENFNRYGSYLQEKGYSYTEDDCIYDYEACIMDILLSNGSTGFKIDYQWENERLIEAYPEGVTPEPVSAGKTVASIQPKLNTISAGLRHTVGLKSDGTVVAMGDNDYGQCDVNGWTDIKLPTK